MAEEPKFKVFVQNLSASVQESVEDWSRAQKASDLPELSEGQKVSARKWGISEEEYARLLLAGHFRQERIRNRGKALGKLVEEVLGGLGPGYRLLAVTAETFQGRWVFRVETPQAIVNVRVLSEFADDLLGLRTLDDIEQLKNLLLRGLGRDELIRGRQMT